MLSVKYVGMIALAQALGAAAFAADPPHSTCKDDPTKKITVTRIKSSEPMVQEITLHCGTQTATQTAPSAPSATEHTATSTFNWDKLIEAVFKLLGSIAWPMAAVYIAFIFRKELAALLTRLKKGKWGSAEFEFENYVRTVDAEADIPRTPENERISPSAAARASSDPRGAIVTAWIEVEDALFSLVRNRELSEPVSATRPSRSTVWAIRAVQKAQVLDASWIALFHDLRAMRNEAAHSTDFSPPPDAVIKYVRLAKVLTAAMRAAGG